MNVTSVPIKPNPEIRLLEVPLRKMRYCATTIRLLCSALILGCVTSSGDSPDYNRTPILFVHGYGSYANCWDPMIKYLVRSGYPREYLKAIQLYPNTGSNIDAAENQIAPAIEKQLETINTLIKKGYPSVSPKKKIDLISKSMGALSSRWYAARVRPDRVRIWLSFGGAHHGTDVLCGYSDQGANDCCPAYAKTPKESIVQHTLNGSPSKADVDETPYGLGKDSPGVNSIPPDNARSILYVSIRTSPDKWIKPEDSPILDGAGGLSVLIPNNDQAKETSPGNILMTNCVGHDAMLKCPDTMRLLATILN